MTKARKKLSRHPKSGTHNGEPYFGDHVYELPRIQRTNLQLTKSKNNWITLEESLTLGLNPDEGVFRSIQSILSEEFRAVESDGRGAKEGSLLSVVVTPSLLSEVTSTDSPTLPLVGKVLKTFKSQILLVEVGKSSGKERHLQILDLNDYSTWTCSLKEAVESAKECILDRAFLYERVLYLGEVS